MSDEIKEMNFSEMLFNRDERLLDYITNLQTIEREYSSLLSENAELQQENDRLNNIRQYAIQFININQHEKTFALDYYDLKKLRGILNDDDFYIELFKEQLKELKENK